MTRSTTMENPTGGVASRRVDMPPALSDDLLERILANANLRQAWARVKSNGGAAGVDGISIDAYPAWIAPRWSEVHQALWEGTYQPSPVLRVWIAKASGGQRPLGIPTVQDRLIQQALLQVLEPLFDPDFSESSFGFRPRRSAHGAVKQIQATVLKVKHFLMIFDDFRSMFGCV